MFLGGGAWDKSFLLTLYNGPKNFLHSTKKYSYDIPLPRLSILANSHPQTMEKLLNQEKLSAELPDSARFCLRLQTKIPFPLML